MNFKLNALVAAALLVAAGSANAAIELSSSGNGELFLVVNDTTAGYSFVGDLGIKMDDFTPGQNQGFAMADWAQWDDFLATPGVNLDNANFAVLALDSLGTQAGNDRMWLTSSQQILASDLAATQNKQLGAATPVLDGSASVNLLYQLNRNDQYEVLKGDMDTVADGSAICKEGSFCYWEGVVGDSMKAKLAYPVLVDANEAANFGFMVTTASQTTLSSVDYQPAGEWTVNAQSLQYTAPVPEAETYGMMLAGLGLVGYMVRRRNAA
jgi:hypothetical protein